ncbi:hypothetical protein [Listeria monocytogenes]|uniref:hypothetical protein n=1 Tax=Listeria monocytogenes TaxID=1639 RepID=UPI00087357DA|nr:hypothetical protein [Listeria monocytogenes]EAD4088951.1 hypothetical protein [Listeria monocytogenes]EAD6805579.1 hypothetical protein [Listeria monocytogenes]EAF2116416.1 hypothetical protein [Listeria monocytogenes]EKZ0807703.1 hypothetical protein [Listeria monocytogenes]OFF92128.1 hypothetical protein BJM52_05480 [Listeria monocytogenes]
MKKMILGFVIILNVFLFGCGEPELSIEEKQKDEFVINVNGKTDSSAKVTMMDESGEKSDIVNSDGDFVLVVPRMLSDTTYQVTSEKGDKKKTTKVKVPKKNKLIAYYDFEKQFNELSEQYSGLNTKIPSFDSAKDQQNGFSVSLDKKDIMSIRLSYSENNSDTSNSSFTDYQDFILSVAATNVILNRAIEGTDTIDFIKKAVDEKEDATKTVDNITYNVSNLDYMGKTITSVMIYPK